MFGMMNPPLSSRFTPGEVSFTTWETPNLELLLFREIFTILIITFLLEWFPTNPLRISSEWGFTILDRAMVHTRTLDGMQFSSNNLSRELGDRCRNLVSLF
jgi:hypothetical protein